MATTKDLSSIWDVFDATDWSQLAVQKQSVCDLIERGDLTAADEAHIESLIAFISVVQDAALEAGYDVYSETLAELLLNNGMPFESADSESDEE